MIGIVMEHCGNFYGIFYPTMLQRLTVIGNIQIYKFGTIIFFLLSGFLIGDKIKTTTAKDYMAKRFSNTIKPWLFWVFLYILLSYVTSAIIYFKFHPSDFWQTPTLPITYQLKNTLLFTNYWFILNFMICLGMLLAFRKYLDSYYFGGILLLLSLFYSVNLYFNWIETSHTTAVVGFVFYLWLGYQLHRHYDAFKNWVNSLSGWILTLALLVTLAIAIAESYHLLRLGSTDGFNTLRASNILYSLVAFVALFKYSKYFNVSVFKPRHTTYGIYLIHQLIIFHFLPLIFYPLGYHDDINNVPQIIGMQLIRFVMVYGVSYGLTLLLTYAPKRISWIVGQ